MACVDSRPIGHDVANFTSCPPRAIRYRGIAVCTGSAGTGVTEHDVVAKFVRGDILRWGHDALVGAWNPESQVEGVGGVVFGRPRLRVGEHHVAPSPARLSSEPPAEVPQLMVRLIQYQDVQIGLVGGVDSFQPHPTLQSRYLWPLARTARRRRLKPEFVVPMSIQGVADGFKYVGPNGIVGDSACIRVNVDATVVHNSVVEETGRLDEDLDDEIVEEQSMLVRLGSNLRGTAVVPSGLLSPG